MMAPIYPQPAAVLQLPADKSQALVQQFGKQGIGRNPQLVSTTTTPSWYTVYIVTNPSGATIVDVVLDGAGRAGRWRPAAVEPRATTGGNGAACFRFHTRLIPGTRHRESYVPRP